MILKALKIAGFRGFNAEREVVFHPHLTLIAAPNSYGKTSIAEALEFLLFGQTSKVRYADSRDEHKDSYRNRHSAKSERSYISAVLMNDEGTQQVLRRELEDDGSTRCFVDGTLVEEWPFTSDLNAAATPFVIQHALKKLLLVPPADRFVGFAQLLGLNDVDAMHRAIASLCTKPEVALPAKASKYLESLEEMERHVAEIPGLRLVSQALKKGAAGVGPAIERAQDRACALTGEGDANLLAALARKRDEIAKEVYAGDPSIAVLSAQDAAHQRIQLGIVTAVGGAAFVTDMADLARYDALARLQQEADFLDTGIQYLRAEPGHCPLCKLPDASGTLEKHLLERHELLLREIKHPIERDPRDRLIKKLTEARAALSTNWGLVRRRASDLVGVLAEDNEKRVRDLLVESQAGAADVLVRAATAVKGIEGEVIESGKEAKGAIEACELGIKGKCEQVSDAEAVCRAIQGHILALAAYNQVVDDNESAVRAAADALRRAVDAKAGTGELTTLSRLLESQDSIRRATRLRSLLDGLKLLKAHAQQSLGEVMEAAFSEKLTNSVMRWYGMIRTRGDPDVHFAGFAMERTKAGDFKNGKVRIAAKSYGVELASAVSSLSESKLNALGLCVSIATATDNVGPCGFIVLDDPIQSWDADHEQQFISLIRELADVEKKQVILLSHRDSWINNVADGCQSIRGIRYEITGYDKKGPYFAERMWMPVDERLKGILLVATNNAATVLDLQKAEGDVRVATCDLTATATKRRLKRDRDASKLNRKDTRALLLEMKCPPELADRVLATFGASDDAHHVPKDYEPNRERLRQFHGTLLELKAWAEGSNE